MVQLGCFCLFFPDIFPDVLDDGWYVSMVLHHFLMMAAALIGRSASYCEAHEDIDLKEASICFAAVEELLIELQKSHVGMVLICSPE